MTKWEQERANHTLDSVQEYSSIVVVGLVKGTLGNERGWSNKYAKRCIPIRVYFRLALA